MRAASVCQPSLNGLVISCHASHGAPPVLTTSSRRLPKWLGFHRPRCCNRRTASAWCPSSVGTQAIGLSRLPSSTRAPMPSSTTTGSFCAALTAPSGTSIFAPTPRRTTISPTGGGGATAVVAKPTTTLAPAAHTSPMSSGWTFPRESGAPVCSGRIGTPSSAAPMQAITASIMEHRHAPGWGQGGLAMIGTPSSVTGAACRASFVAYSGLWTRTSSCS